MDSDLSNLSLSFFVVCVVWVCVLSQKKNRVLAVCYVGVVCSFGWYKKRKEKRKKLEKVLHFMA